MSPPARGRAVLLTDAYWRKTVAAVRSLGRAGAPVDACDPRRVAPAAFSRFCRRRLRCPDPGSAPSAFVDWVRARLEGGDYGLLLPAEERTSLVLAEAAGRIPPGVWLPVPPRELLEEAADKLGAVERAARVGIPTPTSFPFDPDEPAPARGRWLLKPRRGTGAYGVRRLAAGEPPGPVGRGLEPRFGALLLQELVPGRRNGYGVSLLYDREGRCRAGFVHRKIREYPASGGVSTCAESVCRPDLLRLARRYVEQAPAISWQGVLNLEFKVHPATGTAMLIEANPRLWGSLPLAIRAGVDFPALLWRLSQGEDPPPAFDYPAGVRLRWAVYGELAHAWDRLRRGDLPWDVAGEESHGDFLWDRGDPVPFWASLAAWGLALASARRRARLRR